MNTRELQQALARPFHQDEINWRIGSTTKDGKRGLALAYIDARCVMNRLDCVLGIDGWQDEYQVIDGRTLCRLGVRIDGEWVWKSDGAGDSQVEGEKGGISDAFKRAAVKFGVGRYLYDLDSPWVELDENKRIKTRPQLPPWALPENHMASFRANGGTNGHLTGTPGRATGAAAYTGTKGRIRGAGRMGAGSWQNRCGSTRRIAGMARNATGQP